MNGAPSARHSVIFLEPEKSYITVQMDGGGLGEIVGGGCIHPPATEVWPTVCLCLYLFECAFRIVNCTQIHI